MVTCARAGDTVEIVRTTQTETHSVMLIIKRKLGEQVKIANDIVITVREIHAHEVSIGIEAPRNVIVDRMEVAARRRKGARK